MSRPRSATASGRGPECAAVALGRRPTPFLACPERSRRDRRLSAKQRGELAELAFLHRAAALGLGVLKPLGDSLPYDVVVDNGRRLLRVQVKSVSRPHRGVYEVNAGRGRNVKRAYTSRDIDFLAAGILTSDVRRLTPEVWFLFPLSAFAPRKTIRLSPRRPGRWLPYREAWHLLQVA